MRCGTMQTGLGDAATLVLRRAFQTGPVRNKITFGEMCSSGVRDVLIYCRDHRCIYHVEANADGWADGVRLSDTCARCSIHAANCSTC